MRLRKSPSRYFPENDLLMIYLEQSHDAQPLFIPKSRDAVGDLRLTLRGTVSLALAVDAETIDLATSGLYFRVAVTLPEGAPAGEYEYTLADDCGALSTGIVAVGGVSGARQYDNTIEYEQYESI